MDKELLQQGDVLFFRQDNTQLPKGLSPVKKDPRGTVFAEGEATGHYHATDASTSELYKDTDEQLWCDVKEPSVVTHQEHGNVVLNPGLYRIGIVQEVDPFTKEIEKVRD